LILFVTLLEAIGVNYLDFILFSILPLIKHILFTVGFEIYILTHIHIIMKAHLEGDE